MEKKPASKTKNNKKKVKVFTKKRKQGEPENVLIEKLKSRYENIDSKAISKFSDLPLSHKTIKALRECKYVTMTEIQKASIPLALQGKDILGAAQTGSGKTLAFLIPIIERLYCDQWTRIEGVGVIVITPTRELAYQIFETLRKVGKYHDFSAGLIIGGKDLNFEKKRMDQCNIVICTPGRLLQHMDENPLFDCVNMKILVLDEADRCLDMGFKATMNSIIANLPLHRQTLLFSATQTKSVQDLARLSLKDPSYVSVNDMATPKDLQQSYVICQLQDKLSILWSFVRNHLKKKIIIFFSTCKQVKYFYEIFCKLRPGISLMPLYGTLHQERRMKIYDDFCGKQSAVLFATDLAARGLDFPEVHWVVQADCPEDADTYIHRVGRTARYHKGGESLMLLLASEVKMLDYLQEKKIPIEKIDINPSKLQNPVAKIEVSLTKDLQLKETAQRAVSHYARSIFFMKYKDVFDVQALDFEAYAKSLGLTEPPRIRFLNRMLKKQQQGEAFTKALQLKPEETLKNELTEKSKTYFDSDSEDDTKIANIKTTSNLLKEQEHDNINAGNHNESDGHNEDDSDNDTLHLDDHYDLKNNEKPKPILENMDNTEVDSVVLFNIPQTKRKIPTKTLDIEPEVNKTLSSKKKLPAGTRIVFDDDGNMVPGNLKISEIKRTSDFEFTWVKERAPVKQIDQEDKGLFKTKVKTKHKKEKLKIKAQLARERGEEEVDEFGESEDDEAPDLSWLPDPDQVYSEPTNGDSMELESRLSESIDSEEPTKTKNKKMKKRKSELENSTPNGKKKRKIEQLSSTLDLPETEELALMLLKGIN